MDDFMKPSHVFLDSPSTNVDEALAYLSTKAVELGISDDETATLEAFRRREAEGTTGMMEGFAIPHAKSEAINETGIIVARFSDDVEWESMDGKPIRVAIALCVPASSSSSTHLKLLSQLAILLTDADFRERTLVSADVEGIAADINAGLSS